MGIADVFKDTGPVISGTALISVGVLDVSFLTSVLLALLLFVQLGYVVWKWVADYKDRKKR
mgnify:FL=1